MLYLHREVRLKVVSAKYIFVESMEEIEVDISQKGFTKEKLLKQ